MSIIITNSEGKRGASMAETTLAELRKEKHLSQKQLAEKLNVSIGTVGMWESGKRNPPLKRAMEVANYFCVPVESISFSSKKAAY